MIIKMNDKDISDILLSFKRSGSMNRIVGNAPTQSLKISLDNSNGLFDYKTVNAAVFEVQPTPKSNKYFFKAYEMPETWDSILELTLYDCMYIFDASYDTKIEYPATIEAQLMEMQSITGIEIDYSSVDQAILKRETNQYDSTLTMRSYLRWIGEISGCNVMAGHDQYGKAIFVPFQSTVFAEYKDLLDYKKGNPYIISKVSFNDGIRIFNKGTANANTYYLSSDNIYITDQEHINIVSQKLIGLSVNSASNVNTDYCDNLTLGNVIKCLDEFSFVVLNFEEKYAGGDEPDYILSGEFASENQETVGVRVSNSAKIRRLKVITNEQDLSLSVLAKQQNELGSQQSEFKISLEGIQETIKKTEENVDKVFKNFTVYLETNRLASQVYDSNALTYIPDFFTNNLVITAHAYDLEGNELSDAKYEWKRKTENGLEPLVAGEHVNNNILTISHNFDETVTFVCTATLDLISKKEELTVISTKTGKDGQDGKVGPQGPQGIQGPKGENGRNSYFHVKYSQNANGNPMSDSAVDAVYIGVAVTESSTAPASYTSYSWSKIKGEVGPQGETGTIGPKGSDGKTSYLHIKYSDNGTTFTSNNGETPGKYIGTYVDFTEADSSVFNDYTWVKVEGPQGVQGPKGENGKQYYTWLKYADTPTTGMSDNPAGKVYIGLAYNKETSTESNNYSDYMWSLIKGPKGDQGVAGGKGADGTTFYTWIKYATSSSGANMSDDPAGKTYIGLAYNKPTSTESTNAADYTWSLIKGDKGDKGDAGKGIKSTAITYQAGTSGTTAPTGTWAVSIPTVAQGQYLWSKTVITYTDNTTSTTYSVAYIPKNGTNGTNGATGATGTGVNTIVQQYYLSTSKTAQSGGSWVTAMPVWSVGKYLWTRFQINYKNPASTVYTTPVCDSSWEAVNEIQVGAKNLLLNSDEVVTNASYPIKQYKMSEKMVANETYTCRLWGTLGAGKSYFGLWLDGGSISLGSLVNKGNGIFELTFKGKAGTLEQSVINVYPVASSVSVNSTITKIKLEKGNKATDWTPAPEDINEKFDEAANDLATQLSNAKAEFSSDIVKTADTIKQEVSASYYSKDDGELLAKRTTELEHDSQSWTFNFETLTKQLAGLDKEQKENYARILKYIRFENGNIILGESGNALTLTIQNDKIVFKQSDKELAYFTNGKLYVTNGEFTQSLRIGQFAFVPRSNGSLDFKKVG